MAPKSDLIKALLRGQDPADELLAQLAARPTPALESYQARANPGLLGRIGETLDIPGRLVRETLTGRPGATGRDVLGLGRNAPGLDTGDVAGFAAEVALDPLNLISGIGVATKAGRGAERAAKLTADLNAARKLAGAARTAGQASEQAIQLTRAREALQALRATRAKLAEEGAETTLRKGWRAQAQAPVPQRALLSVGLPFTEGVPLIRGGRVLGALEWAGGKIAGSPPGRLARKLFDPGLVRNVLRPGEFVPRSQEGRALMEASEGGVQRAVQDTTRYQEDLAAEIAKREAAGVPTDDLMLQMRQVRESLGVPESATAKGQQVIGAGKAKGQQLEERYLARRKAQNEKAAEQFLARGDAEAAQLERAAQEVERLASRGGPGDHRRLRLEARARKLRKQADLARDRGLDGWRTALARGLTDAESAKLIQRRARIEARAQVEATPAIQRAGEAESILQGAPPENVALAQRIGGAQEEVVQQEILSGARPETSYTANPLLAYAERIMTPAAREAVAEAGLTDDLARHMETRGGVLGAGDMHHRVERFHDVYTDAVNEFMQQKFPNLKDDWFEMDFSKSAPMRFLSGKMRTESAKLANAAIESFPNVAHTPGQTMALEEFIAKSPLHRLRGQSLSGDPAALSRQLKAMGMAGRGVPIDVASQVLEQQAKLTSPEEMQKLLGMTDDLTKIWKIGATLPFPGHHAKNLTGNTVLQWIFNMADPRVMWEAFKRAVIAPLRGDNSALLEMEQIGILRGTQLTELLDTGGVRKSAQTPISGWLFDRFPKLKSAAEKSKKYTQLVENFSRTWGYLSRLKAGDTPMEAARATRKVLLDYSELTDFERLAMRRVIPFYSWTRKVLPRLLESFVKEPRKAALAIRTTTQPTVDRGGVVPEFVRQSGAIPAGVDDQGAQRFIYGLGSPYEELNKLDTTSPEGGVLGGLRKLGRAVGSQVNPFIKAPVELATGHELFFDRDIIHGDRAEPILSKIPGIAQALEIQEEQTPSGKRLRGDPYLLWALRQLPGSRGIREAGSLANAAVGIDPRGNRLNDLLTFLTGARTTTVGDADRIRTMQDINRRLATKLVREGKLGQVPTQFATALGKTDEETLGLLKEQQRLRKELDRLRGEDPDEMERLLQRESRKLQRAGR